KGETTISLFPIPWKTPSHPAISGYGKNPGLEIPLPKAHGSALHRHKDIPYSLREKICFSGKPVLSSTVLESNYPQAGRKTVYPSLSMKLIVFPWKGAEKRNLFILPKAMEKTFPERRILQRKVFQGKGFSQGRKKTSISSGRSKPFLHHSLRIDEKHHTESLSQARKKILSLRHIKRAFFFRSCVHDLSPKPLLLLSCKSLFFSILSGQEGFIGPFHLTI
ncbi:MAG TPA: hypothetical protein PLW97_09065, partial [Synergistaceae bacterium]|nr:hypothetical protein [Synergistaceae bacterium]